MHYIAKFFIQPVASVKEYQSLDKKTKIGFIILVLWLIIFNLSYNMLLWFIFNPLWIIIGLWFHLLSIITFRLIWIFFNYKGGLIDTSLFYFISLVPFLLFSSIINIIWILTLSLMIFIGLIWSLVLLSKSLSQAWKVSESKITIIVILTAIALWIINSYLIVPSTGVSLF